MLPNMGGMGDMAGMLKKTKDLQNKLSNTLIRSKESGIIIDITADGKLKSVKIEDDTLLTPDRKEELEENLKNAFIKGQAKIEEVAMGKTKEILGFDPKDIGNMLK